MKTGDGDALSQVVIAEYRSPGKSQPRLSQTNFAAGSAAGAEIGSFRIAHRWQIPAVVSNSFVPVTICPESKARHLFRIFEAMVAEKHDFPDEII